MLTLVLILLSTLLVSLISFVGIFFLLLRDRLLKKILLFLVSLSTGALMGGAFIHLIPESFEKVGTQTSFYILLGFIVFFITENFLYWRHCHERRCPIHTFGYMNLLGDGIHNFVDGLVIAASFLTNFRIGLVTTLAVALHEIPQEIGDMGVLLYAGFKKWRALILNFICAIIAILGGEFGYFLHSYVALSTTFLLPIAAGGFIYIAASDLVPEMRKEVVSKRCMCIFLVFLLGIALMFSIKFLEV